MLLFSFLISSVIQDLFLFTAEVYIQSNFCVLLAVWGAILYFSEIVLVLSILQQCNTGSTELSAQFCL